MDDIDQRMAEADSELQQMAVEAADNAYRAGANPDDLKMLTWLAGIEWTPKTYMEKHVNG